jgi:hypothetical protein
LASDEAFQSWKLNFADKHATWLERKIYQAREKATFLHAEGTRYLKYSVPFRCDHSGALIKAKTKGIITRYILFSLIVNLISTFDTSDPLKPVIKKGKVPVNQS